MSPPGKIAFFKWSSINKPWTSENVGVFSIPYPCHILQRKINHGLLSDNSLFNCVSTCWLNRPVGTKEMSQLTGTVAVQSVWSSESRSFTYPKSACFQKISLAPSTEWALRHQRFGRIRKAKTVMENLQIWLAKFICNDYISCKVETLLRRANWEHS